MTKIIKFNGRECQISVELESINYICADCGLEFNANEMCSSASVLPVKVCHDCYMDMVEGYTEPETNEQLIIRLEKSEYYYLYKALGEAYVKSTYKRSRKGTPKENISFWREKLKGKK